MTDAHAFQLLDTVTLLEDAPDDGLARGQVGTLVEPLGVGVWLVEFSDDAGRTYAEAVLDERLLMALRFSAAA